MPFTVADETTSEGASSKVGLMEGRRRCDRSTPCNPRSIDRSIQAAQPPKEQAGVCVVGERCGESSSGGSTCCCLFVVSLGARLKSLDLSDGVCVEATDDGPSPLPQKCTSAPPGCGGVCPRTDDPPFGTFLAINGLYVSARSRGHRLDWPSSKNLSSCCNATAAARQ